MALARFFAAMLVGSVASADGQTQIAAMPAKLFLETIGVNVHMEYSDGLYSNWSNVANDLAYLGVHHVRDGVPQPYWGPAGFGLAAIKTLADKGIRFNLDFVGGSDIDYDLRQLDALEIYKRGMIASIEGPNEINNSPVVYKGLAGQTAAETFQHDLYTAVKSDPLLQSIPVVYFTGGAPVDLSKKPGFADYANCHPYPHGGDQPALWINNAFSINFAPGMAFPRMVTECGYYTLPSSKDWGGVDAITQAKGIITTYFETVKQNITRTFVYELLDPYPDPKGTGNDAHFGFFELDNTPKASGVALHNLTSFLADPKTVTASLNFTLHGAPSSVNSLLIGKSDGSFVLAIWNRTPFWNAGTSSPLNARPVAVILRLGANHSITRFDPLTGLSESLSRNSNTATLEVPDHPILISISKPK